MDEQTILRALEKWNLWNRDIDSGVDRPEYLSRFESYSRTGQVVAVSGARRSGKSYLLRQHLKKVAKIRGPKATLFINFEEPAFPPQLQKIIEIYRQHISPSSKPVIFLDEVQKISGWEKVVRPMHERGEADFFVSGSTSKLLSKEYGTLLTGRHLDIGVYPLSFHEFLQFNGLNISRPFELISAKEKIQNLLLKYLKEGGFPKVVLSDEKEILLSTYFQDIISRDIVDRYEIRENALLKDLAHYYVSNIAGLHSNNRIKKFIDLSHETIGRFNGYMEDASLFFFMRKYSHSLKEQQIAPKKVYCIDNGLVASLAFKEMEGLGKLMENLVYLELRRRGKEIYYWKNRYEHEIDFVIKERDKVELIQVCYDYEAAVTREKRSIESWKKENGENKSKIISWDYEEAGETEVVPLYRWLLQPYLQK